MTAFLRRRLVAIALAALAAIDRLLAFVPGPEKYVTGVRALLQLGFPGEAVAVRR